MNFSGQPTFNHLLNFIDKNEIKQIAKKHEAERYVKKITTYHHLVVMLYASIEGYHSIRETILGLLANTHRLSHLGLSYLVRRSTLSEASEIQIWVTLLANLLITLAQSKLKRSWAFSNLVSVIRQQLMNYIDMYSFLEDPEESWRAIIKENKDKYSLFPEMRGTYF
jgi:hypothetical protein